MIPNIHTAMEKRIFKGINLIITKGSCSNTSRGDQFCLRYGWHVVYRMEDICQQGCN